MLFFIQLVYVAVQAGDKRSKFSIFIHDDIFGSQLFSASVLEEQPSRTAVTKLTATPRSGFR